MEIAYLEIRWQHLQKIFETEIITSLSPQSLGDLGRYGVKQIPHQINWENSFISTVTLDLDSYNIAELKFFELQIHEFQYKHHKKYTIPKLSKHEIIQFFKEKNKI